MDKYPKTGGEDSIARTRDEVVIEEELRLGPFKPLKPLKLGHLTLMQTLPDCVFIRKPEPDDISA